jgi:uncharacterized protein
MTSGGCGDVVRRMYVAFRESDQAALMECFHADVHLVQVGNSELAGQFTGHAQLFGHFADIARLTDRMSMEPEQVLEGVDYVTALNRMTVHRNGDSREFRVVHIFRVEAGRITQMRSIPEDPYGLDLFFGA